MARKRRRGAVRWRKEIRKYVIDFYDNLGKRHVETAGSNWHDANRILDERMHEINSGVFDPVKRNGLFKDYARNWFKGKVGIKTLTGRCYGSIIENHLVPYFGEARIQDLRREDIRNFIGVKKEQGSSPKTIRNILGVLRQILGDAEVEGILARNPYLKIEPPRMKKTERDYLRTHEIRLFLDKCIGQDYPLFYTAIFTGMRRGELLAFQWGDIDWASSTIHVRRSLWRGEFQEPKSEYSRGKIDMGPGLIQVLKAHRAKQNEIRLKAGIDWVDKDLVFCHRDGMPLDGDNLYHRDLPKILKAAGLRKIRIHDLRHTFASILIAAGHNQKYIQSQMRHASIKITMDLYGHLMPEVYEGAARKSENFVFGERLGNVTVTYGEKAAEAKL